MRRGRMRTVRLLRRGIGVAWWLTWTMLALFLVAVPVLTWVTGAPASTPFYDAAIWAEPLEGAEPVTARGWGDARLYGIEVNVEFTAAPQWFVVSSLAGWGVVLGLFLFFLYHLRKLAERVEAGAAFDPDNTRRLRLLGGALMATELIEGVLMWWQSHVAIRVAESTVFEFGRVYEVDPTVLFAALVLFVLAEIFQRGTLLEEDQALTV